MRKERQTLKVSSLLLNDGRLGWLPANPRQWTAADLDRIANSIQTDPDFLEDRPVLVVPCDKKYIVFGGNMRREGSDKVGLKEIPAVIYYPETDADRDTIKRRAILDNGQFGAWDFDALANEWDDLPLTDWGVPAWQPETYHPNLEPIDGAKPVTDEDIHNAEGQIEDEVTPTEKTLIEVVCPHCGKTFQVKI